MRGGAVRGVIFGANLGFVTSLGAAVALVDLVDYRLVA